MKKKYLSLFVLAILANGILFTSCNKDDNNTEQQTEQQFQEELNQAEYYKKLSIEYSSHFDPDFVK